MKRKRRVANTVSQIFRIIIQERGRAIIRYNKTYRNFATTTNNRETQRELLQLVGWQGDEKWEGALRDRKGPISNARLGPSIPTATEEY